VKPRGKAKGEARLLKMMIKKLKFHRINFQDNKIIRY
jgi:hypothetical protein